MDETKSKANWKSRMLIGVSAIVIVSITIILLQVDNWSRDFSENHAETTTDAKDPLLRPQMMSIPIQEAETKVRETARSLPRWAFVEKKTWEHGGVWLYYTRKTLVFRFVDDVIVKLVPIEDGSTQVEVESQSRVGKGDLGQNPRNIKELLSALTAGQT